MAKAIQRIETGGAVAARRGRGASAAYIQALREEFLPDDLARMMADTYEDAVAAGDHRVRVDALKLLASYVIGKPAAIESRQASGANRLQAALAAWVEAKAAAEFGQVVDVGGDGDGLSAPGRLFGDVGGRDLTNALSQVLSVEVERAPRLEHHLRGGECA